MQSLSSFAGFLSSSRLGRVCLGLILLGLAGDSLCQDCPHQRPILDFCDSEPIPVCRGTHRSYCGLESREVIHFRNTFDKKAKQNARSIPTEPQPCRIIYGCTFSPDLNGCVRDRKSYKITFKTTFIEMDCSPPAKK